MGSTTNKHFALGYQSAMRDIYNAWAQGGYDNIIEWVANNATAPEHADIREHFGLIAQQNRERVTEARRDHATKPMHGTRAACVACDQDIEWSDFNGGSWHDRGGDTHCAVSDSTVQPRLHAPYIP